MNDLSPNSIQLSYPHFNAFFHAFDFHLLKLFFEPHTRGLTLLHSERPKLYAILAFLSAIGLSSVDISQ